MGVYTCRYVGPEKEAASLVPLADDANADNADVAHANVNTEEAEYYGKGGGYFTHQVLTRITLRSDHPSES